MKKTPILAVLIVAVFSINLEAASLSIAKKYQFNLGSKAFPFGSSPNFFNAAYPLKDGGFLLAAQLGSINTNTSWQRFDSAGNFVWTNNLPIAIPDDLIEQENGEFACLVLKQYDTFNTLFTFNANGSELRERYLPPRYNVSLLPERNGILVGGYLNDTLYNGTSYVMKLSTNYSKLWQRDYPGHYQKPVKLAASNEGGYLFAYDGLSFPAQAPMYVILCVAEDGEIRWKYESRIMPGDRLITLNACSDGGALLGFSFEMENYTSGGGTQERNVPYYGGSDIWLVRINGNGQVTWERSYGGVGGETLGSIEQMADGGYLIAAQTHQSQTSGNKMVDGDGIWLLKINENGFKEDEFVYRTEVRSNFKQLLLPHSTGYRLALSPWIADLAVRRVIQINGKSTGSPFKLDYSYDMRNWTNLLSRFNGVFSFEDAIDTQQKYYRIMDLP